MNRLASLWHLLNLSCDGMTRLASESIDRPLTRAERMAMRSHLLYCAACRRYRRQIALIREAMHTLERRLESGVPLPGPGLPDDVRDRLEQTIRAN